MTPQELKKTCRYLVGAARRIWRWDSNRKSVNAISEQAAGKVGYRQCALCLKSFKRTEVHVDHIDPVGHAPTEFIGWDAYYTRLFCEKANLQNLCKPCHKAKTKKEAGERVIKRRAV